MARLSELHEILEKHGLSITITFNTADGKGFRFEGKDARYAYHQYRDPKCEEIFIPEESEIYIVKRHIASVVIGD